MTGAGLTVGTTVGSIIPGVGTGIGATLGTLYDGISSLFGGGHKDPMPGDMKRLSDWLLANNITDQTIINEGVKGVQTYSDKGDAYWNWWEAYRNTYKDAGKNSFTKDVMSNSGVGFNVPGISNGVLLLAVGGIVAYFLLK
jgi:hypothetical protein